MTRYDKQDLKNTDYFLLLLFPDSIVYKAKIHPNRKERLLKKHNDGYQFLNGKEVNSRSHNPNPFWLGELGYNITPITKEEYLSDKIPPIRRS